MTRALRYTYDDLIFQYDASKYGLKYRLINRAEHSRTIRMLNDEQERRDQVARSLEIARQLEESLKKKEAARLARNAKKREERAEKRRAELAEQREIRAVRGGVIYDKTLTLAEYDVEESSLYSTFKPLAGTQFLFMATGYSKDGESIDFINQIMDASSVKSSDVFYQLIRPFIVGYTNGIFRKEGNANVHRARIVISTHTPAESLNVERLKQAFRDGGEKHCVMDPLIEMWQKMEENSESPASIKRCRQVANKLIAMKAMFPNGVPEDQMEDVARAAHRGIVIHDIVGNEYMRFNAKSPKTVYFTNTRENHLEIGHIALDKQYKSVTKEELMDIIAEHERDGVHCLYSGDFKNEDYRSIRSVRGAFAVFNEDHDLFNEFNNKLGIRHYAIQAVKHSALNAFVKESRIIHAAPIALCANPNQLEGVKQMDISKAYTQHKYAPYYQGFLGHIQQWRRIDGKDWRFMESHVGIYKFTVLSEPIALLKKLGIRKGSAYVLPGPEVLYFVKECGLQIKLQAGAWGSTFEIEYPEEMLSNRRYCTWAGKLGSDKDKHTYQFKGSAEWAGHLKAELGNDRVFYYKEFGMIVVDVPKTSYYTNHHILSFITSYTRLNMFKAMSLVKGELVKVVLDGLYYRGEMDSYNVPHSMEKTVSRHEGFGEGWYSPSSFDHRSLADYSESFDGSCVLAGAGGTGKSWSVFHDRGLMDPLYVVPSHVLGRKCRETYDCNYTTIHKLIGMDCRSFREDHRAPAVIFIDELTMMEASWIEKAVSMYPTSLFLVAGDIDQKQWYQCRNGHPGEFSTIWIPSDWRYVMYTKDMRSKDEKLRMFKERVREAMRQVFTDGNQTDASRMNAVVKSMVSTVSFDEACGMFSAGDTWIAGTHRTNDRLLEKGVCSGYINKMKEIVSSEEAGAIKRGSFTIHSFQGLTISSGKVFISFDMFEYAMLYTAISRAIHFDQLVFVQ